MEKETYVKLVGVPYEDKDCWGIVVEFYKAVFSVQLNPYYSDVPESRGMAQALVYTARKDFESVSILKFGDIVLMKMMGFESHIGVYLGEGKMLHTQVKTGCVVDSFAKWEKTVVGCYRPKGIPNDSAT
jgi:cell wall-associated NlpC family hydrolase